MPNLAGVKTPRLKLTRVCPQGKLDMAMMSREDLRRLFTLRQCCSDTHEFLNCKRCPAKPLALTPEEPEQQQALAAQEAAAAEVAAAAQAKGASAWSSVADALGTAPFPITPPFFLIPIPIPFSFPSPLYIPIPSPTTHYHQWRQQSRRNSVRRGWCPRRPPMTTLLVCDGPSSPFPFPLLSTCIHACAMYAAHGATVTLTVVRPAL